MYTSGTKARKPQKTMMKTSYVRRVESFIFEENNVSRMIPPAMPTRKCVIADDKDAREKNASGFLDDLIGISVDVSA